MIPIRCGVNGCGCTVAEVQGSYLVIKSRHHGERHVATIPLASLNPPRGLQARG